MTTPPPAWHPRRSPRREELHSGSRPNRALALTGYGLAFGAALALTLFVVFAFSDSYDQLLSEKRPGTPSWQEQVIFGGLTVLLPVTAVVGGVWSSRRDRVSAERAQQSLRRAEDQLAAGDQLALPALWEVTQKRLDYYHQIAIGQARTSFRNAQAAMVIGFVLLAVFAALATTADKTAAAAVTGALGAVAAALAGYISRTFVRLQESSAGHLRSYFDQPLEFSRYLAAERLLGSVQSLDADQRAAILADLLRTVIAPGAAAAAGGAAAAPPAVTINLPTSAPAPASGDGGSP